MRQMHGLTLDEAFQQSYEDLVREANLVREEEIAPVKLQESISIALIISILLAAPGAIKALARGVELILKALNKLFGKNKDEFKVIDKLIQLADKWHHAYIGIIEKVLNLAGIFKAARVEKGDPMRHKMAEVVYYVIIFGLGVYGGLMAGKSILSMISHAKVSHLNLTLIETVVTAIKSKEVAQFIASIGKA